MRINVYSQSFAGLKFIHLRKFKENAKEKRKGVEDMAVRVAEGRAEKLRVDMINGSMWKIVQK